MYPTFLSGTNPKKTGTRLLWNRMFCCVWKQSMPHPFPMMMLFPAQLWKQGTLGGRLGVHGSWAGFGCAWRSVSILHPQLSHCTAPHTSRARSEAAAQHYLPALKGLRRGWENEFGMECGGKLKASAATVVFVLLFSETGAKHN